VNPRKINGLNRLPTQILREYLGKRSRASRMIPELQLRDERDEEVDPMMTFTTITAATCHASVQTPAPSTRVRNDVWAGVRLVDGDVAAMGPSAWSPPI
jgi:hypothetical protein